MNHTFNLIDEPWIPCLFDDGTLRELGLRAVLKEAPRIREIAHDSPLFVASIHPILVAILHRVLEQQNDDDPEEEWDIWWTQKHFDENAIDAYFEKWRDRFDLFDAEHPFYQVAGLEMSKTSSLFRLAMEEQNTPAMFANRANPDWAAPSPALATQLLVTIQNFALGFGRSSKAKIGGIEIEPPYSADGPLLRGLTVWPSGETLFQTLCLNTVPHELNAKDAPCWELDASHELRDLPIPIPKGQKKKKDEDSRICIQPRGICDLLTLQSRLIRLLPEEIGGETIVPAAYFTQGRSLEKDEFKRPAFHPLKRYYKSPKSEIITLSLSEGKATWRNAHTLFDQSNWESQHQRSPLAFVATITGTKQLKPRLNVVGMATEPGKAGKFLLWRYDRLPFSPAFLSDENVVETLRIANADADLIADEMRARFFKVVCKFIWPDRDTQQKIKLSRNERKYADRIIDEYDPSRDYWPRLEAHFYELLSALAANPDESKTATDKWKSDLQSAARDCLKGACDALGTSPQAICAVAQIDLNWPFNLDYLRNPQDFIKTKKLREAAAKDAAKTASKKAVSSPNSSPQTAFEF